MLSGRDKRLIIKVGTNTLTDARGRLDTAYLSSLVEQIATLRQQGYEVALVSSGAIRAGMARLGLEEVRSLRESQAAAAVGQGILMHLYHELFLQKGLTVAQILLIADDFRVRTRYLNARNTLFTLFERQVVPIINENDTVAVDEIKFGDNDNLAAQVAGLVNAGYLIFLSDVDGLHERQGNQLGRRIQKVHKITASIEALAGGNGSRYSKGGMISKLLGAKLSTEAGAHVFIANGREPQVLQRLLQGEDLGTHFYPQAASPDSRKRWIGMSSAVAGRVVIDKGACRALRQQSKSLLPAGILDCHGAFKAGDVIKIIDADNREVGRGLSNYDAEEIKKIKGIHSRLIAQILGYQGDPEVVHRDNMFVFKAKKEASIAP